MGHSPGSIAFFIIALILVAILVLLLLRRYLQFRKNPAYFLLPVFLGLALPISIILLVPIDLVSLEAKGAGSKNVWLPGGFLLVVWRLLYWLTFALTWAILPVLGEYVDSGYRSPKDRFFYSLRSNGRYYLIVFACAGLAGIYVFLVNGFKTTSLKSLVMALAYCWGLVLSIFLMGHGLVAVPRQLLRNANTTNRLRRVQAGAVKTHEKLGDATNELEELEAQLTQLRRRKNAVSRDHEEWIEEISDASEVPDYRLFSATSAVAAPSLPAVLTDRYLAEFSRKLMRARHKKTRYVDAWYAVIKQSQQLQAVVDSNSSKKIEKRDSPSSWIEAAIPLTARSRYVIHTKIIPPTRLVGGTLLAIASLCVIFSELIKAILPSISIISLSVQPMSTKYSFLNQVTAAFWLLYMSTATLASISSVKIWGNRALILRHTYPESAAWYASQIAKLTVPLAYNFLTLFPREVREGTSFYAVLGRSIDLTPLGSWFDKLFPLFILVPVCAACFNIYGRTSRYFGSGFINDDEENSNGTSALGTGGWREGRDLINREIQAQARAGLNNHFASSNEPYSDIANDSANTAHSLPRHTGSSTTLANNDHRPSAPARLNTGERQAQRLRDATDAAEELDESVFEGFAHRVRNTFDSFERPKWMDDLGKKPKWMGGGGDDENAGGDSGAAGGSVGGGGNAFGRLFGGSGAPGGGGRREGGIRL